MSRDPLNRESYASDAVDVDEFDNLDAVNDSTTTAKANPARQIRFAPAAK